MNKSRLMVAVTLTFILGCSRSQPSQASAESGAAHPLSAEHLARVQAQEGERAAFARTRLLAKRRALGLGEESGFELRSVHTDAFGRTHARFRQTHQSVKVFGAEVIAHLGPEGEDLGATSSLVSVAHVARTPKLQDRDALAVAEGDLRPTASYARPPRIELVVYPERDEVQVLSARGSHARSSTRSTSRRG